MNVRRWAAGIAGSAGVLFVANAAFHAHRTSSAFLIGRLSSTAAFPACAGAVARMTLNQEIWQDYYQTVRVSAPAPCLSRWKTALLESRRFQPDASGTALVHQDENGPDEGVAVAISERREMASVDLWEE